MFERKLRHTKTWVATLSLTRCHFMTPCQLNLILFLYLTQILCSTGPTQHKLYSLENFSSKFSAASLELSPFSLSADSLSRLSPLQMDWIGKIINSFTVRNVSLLEDVWEAICKLMNSSFWDVADWRNKDNYLLSNFPLRLYSQLFSGMYSFL